MSHFCCRSDFSSFDVCYVRGFSLLVSITLSAKSNAFGLKDETRHQDAAKSSDEFQKLRGKPGIRKFISQSSYEIWGPTNPENLIRRSMGKKVSYPLDPKLKLNILSKF